MTGTGIARHARGSAVQLAGYPETPAGMPRGAGVTAETVTGMPSHHECAARAETGTPTGVTRAGIGLETQTGAGTIERRRRGTETATETTTEAGIMTEAGTTTETGTERGTGTEITDLTEMATCMHLTGPQPTAMQGRMAGRRTAVQSLQQMGGQISWMGMLPKQMASRRQRYVPPISHCLGSVYLMQSPLPVTCSASNRHADKRLCSCSRCRWRSC